MVLQEAITLAIGLAIFENGFASSDMQLLHSAKSVIAANASYGHPLIADRFEKDKSFARCMTNYVSLNFLSFFLVCCC